MFRSRYISLLLCLGCILFSFAMPLSADMESSIHNALNDNQTAVVLYFYDDTLTSCAIVDSNLGQAVDSFSSLDYFAIDITSSDSDDIIDEYSVELAPTVIVFDELGELYDFAFGVKSSQYYTDTIFEAMKVDNTYAYNANKFFDNGLTFIELNDYSKAIFYFSQAEALFETLSDVSNRLLCQMNIQRCESYISAYDSFEQAEALFTMLEYADAKDRYEAAKEHFDDANDTELSDYCESQMEKCLVLPSLDTDYQNAVTLFSQNDYSGAKSLFSTVFGGYQLIGDDLMAGEVESHIEKCDDYILAGSLMSEGALSLGKKQYSDAISSYTQAMALYQEHDDAENVALCEQNIGVAQQFIDLEKDVQSDIGDDSDILPFENKYLYALIPIAAIIISLILISSRSSSKREDAAPVRAMPLPIYDKMPAGRVRPVPASKDVEYQSEIIGKKNELLILFSKWMEDFLDMAQHSENSDLSDLQSDFRDLSAVFTNSFSKDEIYLDQALLSNAFINMHKIQQLLAE